MKEQVVELIGGAVAQLITDGILPEGDNHLSPQVDPARIKPWRSCDEYRHGALQARRHGPSDLAAAVAEIIPENTVISQCDVAGPGFINFTSPKRVIWKL